MLSVSMVCLMVVTHPAMEEEAKHEQLYRELRALGEPAKGKEQQFHLMFGYSREDFERQLEPLIAGLAKADRVAVYEGLPHQVLEKDALAAELREKKTVERHGYPFYATPVETPKEAGDRLRVLCGDAGTFAPYRGMSACCVFHPDWCVELTVREDVYRVLVCFGCEEARVYGPKGDVYAKLTAVGVKALVAELVSLRTNRPAPKVDPPKPKNKSPG